MVMRLVTPGFNLKLCFQGVGLELSDAEKNESRGFNGLLDAKV